MDLMDMWLISVVIDKASQTKERETKQTEIDPDAFYFTICLFLVMLILFLIVF